MGGLRGQEELGPHPPHGMELGAISCGRRVVFSGGFVWGTAIKQHNTFCCCYLFLVTLIFFFSGAGKLLSKAGPWRMRAAGLELAHKMALNGEEEMGVKSRAVSLVNQSTCR